MANHVYDDDDDDDAFIRLFMQNLFAPIFNLEDHNKPSANL